MRTRLIVALLAAAALLTSCGEAEPASDGDSRSDRPVDLPYFYGFGCEGAGVTLLEMASFFGEFEPAEASLEDAATFRAMGVALTTSADLRDEGALADGAPPTAQAIYAVGVTSGDLADAIESGGATQEIEDQTSILGSDATRAVAECGLD